MASVVPYYDQGKMVMPSHCFPSSLESPLGSVVAAIWAAPKARLKISFTCWCLGIVPFAFLQDRPCLPVLSTTDPHQEHLYGWNRDVPSLRPQAILKLTLSSFNPRDGTGNALSQSDECSEDTANSLAFSNGDCCTSRRYHFLVV